MMLNFKQSKNSRSARQKILKLYKNRGETPLECLNRFKSDNPEYKDEKMTYAGRLDPLAEGLLLILVGDECKNKPRHPHCHYCTVFSLFNRIISFLPKNMEAYMKSILTIKTRWQCGCMGKEKYLGLDKEYKVDVLFGFATDTYDVLGLVIPAKAGIQTDLINLDSHLHGNDTIKELLNSFIGRFSQKYPPYSSKYFNKARSGELKEDEIEKKDVEIKSIKFLGQRTISKNDLEKYIIESVNLVKGDFRQQKIIEAWHSVFARSKATKQSSVGYIRANSRIRKTESFRVITIRVNCTSGTYMRSLANSIGEKVGIPALALNIKRTRIGKLPRGSTSR